MDRPRGGLRIAATGRGVAVVSDDPRFGLRPLAIHLDGKPLSIRLNAARNPDTPPPRTPCEKWPIA
jgi:hypothetical protein